MPMKPDKMRLLQYAAGYGRGITGMMVSKNAYETAIKTGEYPSSTSYEDFLLSKARLRAQKPATVTTLLGGQEMSEMEKLRRKRRMHYGSTIIGGRQRLGEAATLRKQILG